jgi:hypothetical protein
MWESGMGMSADGAGNLYVVAGNGTVGAGGDPSNLTNRAESALKLTPAGSTLQVASFFTPTNYQTLNDFDLDYGGTGAFLIPHTNFFFTGAKDGNLFLLDRDAMGGYSAAGNQVQQEIHVSSNSEMHCQPAYYSSDAGEFVYLWPENESLHAYPFNRLSNTLGQTVFGPNGPTGHSGAILSVSSNGSTVGTGIVWAAYAFIGDAEHDVSTGILRAFDAADVTHELWNNRQNVARDGSGNYAKFAAPTIANGHVYLPTFSNQVVVYGLQ